MVSAWHVYHTEHPEGSFQTVCVIQVRDKVMATQLMLSYS